MTGFSPSWLALREPADHAARDAGLLSRAVALVRSGTEPAVVDLGAGTGSTLRAFDAHGCSQVRWRLVDGDPVLLQEAHRRHPGVATFMADLRAVETLPFAGAGLVTASALFDLVSAEYVARLARHLAKARLPLYAALTIDGTIDFEHRHPLDGRLVDAVHRHQHRDKGFGTALGGGATAALAEALEASGYGVETAPSPWRLGVGSEALQAAYVEGLADAAAEAGPFDPAVIDGWLAFRRAEAQAGSRCTVGHLDLLALPG